MPLQAQDRVPLPESVPLQQLLPRDMRYYQFLGSPHPLHRGVCAPGAQKTRQLSIDQWLPADANSPPTPARASPARENRAQRTVMAIALLRPLFRQRLERQLDPSLTPYISGSAFEPPPPASFVVVTQRQQRLQNVGLGLLVAWPAPPMSAPNLPLSSSSSRSAVFLPIPGTLTRRPASCR